MLGFLDRDTPVMAERLFQRAQTAADRYLALGQDEAGRRIASDFPDDRRFIGRNEANFGYDDLAPFNFSLWYSLDQPTLSVFGGQQFDGFLLQRSGDFGGWHFSIKKPISRPVGGRARRLANHLERHHGVTDLDKTMARLGARFRR